jgi:NADH-quinone oxidoreductase subunit M
MLPALVLLHLVVCLTTARNQFGRFHFGLSLLLLSLMLATLTCKEPWVLIALLAASALPPYFELRRRGKNPRVYLSYMGLFVVLLVAGWALLDGNSTGRSALWLAVPLVAAMAVRNGLWPFHSWVPDLVQHGSFGLSLLYLTPLVETQALFRLVLPAVDDAVLEGLGILALITSLYGAGLALVQRSPRRYFGFLVISQTACVILGLCTRTHVGITGGLCSWIALTLSVGGLGLVLRSVETRFGLLDLSERHGLYHLVPLLAVTLLIFGITGIGFPGTLGFLGLEMVIDGSIEAFLFFGAAVTLATALNGISVLRVYWSLFSGKRHPSTVSFAPSGGERWSYVLLILLGFAGGLYFAHDIVESRYRVAKAHFQLPAPGAQGKGH